MNQLTSGAKDSSIQNAVNALNDLSAYFSNALNAANAIFQNDLDSVNNRIDQFNAQIDLLTNVLIPQSEADVANTTTALGVAVEQLAADRESLAQAEQDLVNENASFDAITARHNAIVQKVSDEYSVVIQAQQIINEARANLEV